MANEIARLVNHPDTGEEMILVLSDEEAKTVPNNRQLFLEKLAAKLAADETRQADLDEVKGGKLASVLQAMQDDIAAFDNATAAQRLLMQRRTMVRLLMVTRALARLME